MGRGHAGVFVDSGGWIALFRARDAHHQATEAMVRRAIAERIPLVTTNLVVAEVHRFVLHRVGIRPASIALDRDARRWLARLADRALTYTDAVSFAVMKSQRLDGAITFDRDFAVAGFTPWRD